MRNGEVRMVHKLDILHIDIVSSSHNKFYASPYVFSPSRVYTDPLMYEYARILSIQ